MQTRRLQVFALLVITSVLPAQAVPMLPPEDAAMQKTTDLPALSMTQTIGAAPKDLPGLEKGTWSSGTARITTPLPEGYPRPNAPDEIALKTYPVVRRATVEGNSPPSVGRNIGFWKLFKHIESKEIAMTSPVEMEYDGLNLDGSQSSPKWKMAFLYREPSMGEATEESEVKVTDTTPMTVLSLGYQGDYGLDLAKKLLPRLKAELDRLPHLEGHGPLRVLHYNGPDMPSKLRWSEIQIAVRQKPSTQEG